MTKRLLMRAGGEGQVVQAAGTRFGPACKTKCVPTAGQETTVLTLLRATSSCGGTIARSGRKVKKFAPGAAPAATKLLMKFPFVPLNTATLPLLRLAT